MKWQLYIHAVTTLFNVHARIYSPLRQNLHSCCSTHSSLCIYLSLRQITDDMYSVHVCAHLCCVFTCAWLIHWFLFQQVKIRWPGACIFRFEWSFCVLIHLNSLRFLVLAVGAKFLPTFIMHFPRPLKFTLPLDRHPSRLTSFCNLAVLHVKGPINFGLHFQKQTLCNSSWMH